MLMRTPRIAVLAGLPLAFLALGACSRESSRGPVKWTASDPASPVGQSDAQVWSRSTSNDKTKPIKNAAASPLVGETSAESTAEMGASVGRVELPPGSNLTGSTTVRGVRAFPEEAAQPTSRDELAAPTGIHIGTDRSYESDLSYREAIAFFDRTLTTRGCNDTRRTTTSASTLWSVRCADGQRAHVAVRNTLPTTIEVISDQSE